MSDSVRANVCGLFQKAVEGARREGLLPAAPAQMPGERPKRPEHGDYACNVALGFVNLRFSDASWQGRRLEIHGAGKGRGEAAPKAEKPCVEYLSANPTGPLHFVHGRHAAGGDSLTRLLRFAGYDVVRELHLNDAGNQVAMLALSVWARDMEAARAADSSVPAVSFPENGYRGDYIRDIGRELLDSHGTRWVGSAPATSSATTPALQPGWRVGARGDEA